MKKLIALFLAAMMLLSLAACGNTNPNTDKANIADAKSLADLGKPTKLPGSKMYGFGRKKRLK